MNNFEARYNAVINSLEEKLNETSKQKALEKKPTGLRFDPSKLGGSNSASNLKESASPASEQRDNLLRTLTGAVQRGVK